MHHQNSWCVVFVWFFFFFCTLFLLCFNMVFMQGSFTKLLFTALIFTATISFVTFSAPVDPFSYGASGQPHLHPPFPQGLARFTQIQQQLWITRLSWKPHILKQKKERRRKEKRKNKKTIFVKSQNWMYTKNKQFYRVRSQVWRHDRLLYISTPRLDPLPHGARCKPHLHAHFQERVSQCPQGHERLPRVQVQRRRAANPRTGQRKRREHTVLAVDLLFRGLTMYNLFKSFQQMMMVTTIVWTVLCVPLYKKKYLQKRLGLVEE